MATIHWKSQEQINQKKQQQELQKQIKSYEQLLTERYEFFNKLLATDATQEELNICKQEIQLIIQALGGLKNAPTS